MRACPTFGTAHLSDALKMKPNLTQRALLPIAIVLAIVATFHGFSKRFKAETFVLFSQSEPGCAIVIPQSEIAAERRAAEVLRRTLVVASGGNEVDFPILLEGPQIPRRAIFVGATKTGPRLFQSPLIAPLDVAVGRQSVNGTLLIQAERRELIEAAVGWFLERELGVYWFMPGPLGEHVPRRSEAVIAAGRRIARPGFVSRALSGIDQGGGVAWCAINKLDSHLQHGKCFDEIFTPEDFRRDPEMGPIINGVRYLPTNPRDSNWQPDLLQPATINHAVKVIERRFQRSSPGASFSFCTNDSVHFDESEAARAAIGPLRYFRARPDYSDYVFQFTNTVAREVAKKFPAHWITAYAYYWTENAPSFPIERNVIPFLTADRSQWFDPEFAAQDRKLIERWCQSGAGLVGMYDYFQGAPYLLPRPTLYAAKDSIPFGYRAGVRAFYGEAHSNWSLDGPKPWLAAQLLWSPMRDPDELLSIYYRHFWGMAAPAMQEFYELCERAWRKQPLPGYWLKYYRDEDHARLFGPEVRSALRSALHSARARADSDLVRARVDFVSAGFDVSERFGEFYEYRERLSHMAHFPANSAELLAAARGFSDARDRLVSRFEQVTKDVLAFSPSTSLKAYLRSDPSARVINRMEQSEDGRAALAAGLGASIPGLSEVAQTFTTSSPMSGNLLMDPNWAGMSVRSVEREIVHDWTPGGNAWRGHGEPYETRSVHFLTGLDGVRRIRFDGVCAESLGQWVPGEAGKAYLARTRVRAKVSPGNETFLIMTFLDEKHAHVGASHTDRLPTGDWSEGVELRVAKRAPANARFVGLALSASKQVPGDFAEFWEASLVEVRKLKDK